MDGEPRCIRQLPWYCQNAQPFTCTGFGFYPNVYNCRQYFECLAPGGLAKGHECQNGQVFDPMANNNGNRCKVSTSANSCVEQQCGVAGGSSLITYPGFSKSYGSYAVVCNNLQQPEIYRCEDGFEPDINTYPITCTRQCPGNNRRAVDPNDPNAYYSCSYNGGKYVGGSRKCPGAMNALGVMVYQVYNKTTKQCVAAGQ